MSISAIIASAMSTVVSPLANYFTKKDDNKTKVKQQQIDRLMNADDKHAEWETIQAENSKSSWKDEYVTVIITLPIPVLFIGTIYAVLSGNVLVITAMAQAVTAIKELIPNYGDLLGVVCLAALGIKAFKK